MEPGRLIGEQRHTGAPSARELFVVQGETTGTSMSRYDAADWWKIP
jgi:hypothetical protein